MKKGASFDRARVFRYSLHRVWDTRLPLVTFVGLNPSTADENEDDPTIRRCMKFAQSWACGGLVMTNLFAFRSTCPDFLFAAKDPIGRDNDEFLRRAARESSLVIAAWGNHGKHLSRDVQVQSFFPKLHYLRLTRSGQPGHPLYLPGGLRPCVWQRRSGDSKVYHHQHVESSPARMSTEWRIGRDERI